MKKINNLIISQIQALLNKSEITVVCIDGPTAAGKTILAENLEKEIKEKLKVNVEFFRLDWTLKSRLDRQLDLKKLLKDDDDFLLEGELHMNLDIFDNFLNNINNLKNTSIFQKERKIFELGGLYSRENNGECNGTYKYDLSEKTVIICEGHYTSRMEYINLIDLNICLLCDKEELLRRKVERVKSYRSSQDAIDYFWKIDVPSFSYHLERFSQSVDYFIENSDYNNPKILSISEALKWPKLKADLFQTIELPLKNEDNFLKIYKKIFSSSELNPIINFDQFKKLIEFYKSIDKILGERLQENLNYNDKGIKHSLYKKIQELNKNINLNAKNKVEIVIASNSFLYDVYNRKIPVNFGIKVITETKNIYFNFTVEMYKSDIILFWDGGAYEISINRSLTNINDNQQPNKVLFNNFVNLKNKLNLADSELHTIKLFSPTDFCIPEFVKEFKFDFIFTGREHETTLLIEILKKLFTEKNSVLTHRLSINSELRFYLKLLNSLGIPSFKISNYIIALNTKSSKLMADYKSWSKTWYSKDQDSTLDEKNYDECILDELQEANKKLRSFSKNFILIDSFLFKKETNEIDLEINELSIMLRSSNRSLRKRAFQYILKEQPSLEIDTNKLFNCYGIQENEKSINNKFQISDLPKIYPTIMAELYLWQHLRGDKSAILGANIYDLSTNNSLDINALLEASIVNKTGIVFQSSFNAIGQNETENDKNSEGYLKLVNGPNQLVNACISSVLKSTIRKNNPFPFYGIGLDHVDAKNDYPKGRAIRFLDMALSTGNITHVVLDGSALFKAKDRTKDYLTDAYQKVADYEVELIKKRKDLFLIDLEYCVGEMNYIGDSKLSMIPTSYEINLFVDILRKALRNSSNGHFNCRPSLFIGNVGTTHHSKDSSSNIDSSISLDWVNFVKKKNFISAVLHGTTNSEVSILKDATNGCHKVNVAGDFLKEYLISLPKYVDKKLREFGPESKYHMPEISKMKKSFTRSEIDEIENNLQTKSSELIKSINSPKLSERDKSYFHRSSFKFPDKLIKIILEEYKKSKANQISNNFSMKNKKNLFFSASMIEVPFEEGFCEIVDELINSGMKHFHIDVGDGKFISRKFSGLQKLSYLSNLNKNLNLHTHLMVQDPFNSNSNTNSYIDDYIEAGSTSIALHIRSFSSKSILKKAIDHIFKNNCRPGIIIEVTDTNLNYLWEIIEYLNINWVVVMGVPVGYGGQLFQSRCLRTINFLRSKSLEMGNDKFDIEVDGGLNFSNVNQCCGNGANIFAGWSIIKDHSVNKIVENYKKIISQLNN